MSPDVTISEPNYPVIFWLAMLIALAVQMYGQWEPTGDMAMLRAKYWHRTAQRYQGTARWIGQRGINAELRYYQEMERARP